MTLLEIQNQIVNLFLDNEMIMESLIKEKVKVDIHQEDMKDELIELELNHLQDVGILKRLSSDKREVYWILCQPLDAQNQKVELSMDVCSEVADIINDYLKATGKGPSLSDKLNISEKDIIMLISILHETL